MSKDKEEKKTPAPEGGEQPEQGNTAPQEKAGDAAAGEQKEQQPAKAEAPETFTVTREQMEKMEGLAGQLAELNDQHLRLILRIKGLQNHRVAAADEFFECPLAVLPKDNDTEIPIFQCRLAVYQR